MKIAPIAMFNIMLRLPSMDSISLHGYLCTRIRQLLFTGSIWIHVVTKMRMRITLKKIK